jgi:hypothetical protein
VKPDFSLTPDNVEDVERICIALDGVPLAIELAAARVRVLTPAQLLERLDARLLQLGGGVRDLPERQRTIRSTIEWSTQLLGPAEQELLTRLGLFAGGFTLEAAEWIAAGIPDADILDGLGALVDSSLVRQEDRGDRGVFSMLSTVREYALERLESRPDAAELGDRHAQYFVRLGEQAEFELEGPAQLGWIERLHEDGDNIRAAMRHLLDTRQWAPAAHFAWTLYVYWWVDGHLGEVLGWMREVLDSGDELDDLTRATALYFNRANAFWQDPDDWLVPGLDESAALFRREGERSGEALALISLALALLGAREPDSARADDALGDVRQSHGRADGRRPLCRAHDRERPWHDPAPLVPRGRRHPDRVPDRERHDDHVLLEHDGAHERHAHLQRACAGRGRRRSTRPGQRDRQELGPASSTRRAGAAAPESRRRRAAPAASRPFFRRTSRAGAGAGRRATWCAP